MKRSGFALGVVVAAAVAGALGMWGIRWGLPSAERNACYFSGPQDFPSVPEDEVRDSAERYPEFSDAAPRPRSTFNAVRSLHPDEHYVLKGIANMDPLHGDFSTGLYGWPSLIFYIEAFGLAVGWAVGYVTLSHDLGYYFAHPEQIAHMYLVGRWLVAALGVGAVALLCLWGRDHYDAGTGILAGALMATLPLATVHMHYMTGDIPMLFFLTLGLWWCSKCWLCDGRRWPILAGAALGLAMSAKYKAVILLPMIPLAVWLRLCKDMSPRRAAVNACTWQVAGGVAAALGVFAVLNFSILLHPGEFWRVFSGEVGNVSMNVGACAASQGVLQQLARMLAEAVIGPAKVLFHCVGAAPLALAAIACIAGVIQRRREDMLLTVGGALVYAAMGLIGTIYGRHMMPLLPFVALLAARCVTWIAWGIRSARLRACTASVLVVLLVGPGLWRSVGYCRLFGAKDVRLEAGEWIAQHIAPGAAIGMAEVPWQYDTPPINELRYKVVVTGYDAGKLRQLKPEYYFVSSRHTDPLLRKPTRERRRFWQALRELYGPLHAFERMPFVLGPRQGKLGVLAWLGLSSDNSRAPEDMRYANPKLTLYRRQ